MKIYKNYFNIFLALYLFILIKSYFFKLSLSQILGFFFLDFSLFFYSNF
jgi:hypothetical protein